MKIELYTIITKSEPRMFINRRGELVNNASDAEFFIRENEATDSLNALDKPELFEIVTAKLDIGGDSVCQ